jgi:serine protease AprX
MTSLFGRVARSVTIFLPLICLGDPSKIASDLANADPHSVVNVIVQFNLPPSSQDLGAIGQLGGQEQADLGLIQSKLFAIPAAALNGIAHNPHVSYISPDRVVSGMLDYANGAIGAPAALAAGWTGAGVGVAVIDSGISNQTDLLNRIVYSQSFVPKVTTTLDQYGHGTHVAGLVAGNGAASTGTPFVKTFRGVATKANLINLRVLDANGAGTDSAVISAITTAIQQKSKYNIRVINLSLGRPVFESYTLDPLCQAAEQAWNAGIVVVVAAGNNGRNQTQGTDGYATITAPGNDPLVITVGAMKTMGTLTRADDLIASYSSKGPTLLDHVVKPDIVAPGNRIISLEASKTTVLASSGAANLVPFSYYQNPANKGNSPDYFRLSGTSMAAPMVSGTVALMLNKDSTLTPDTVKARLMKTATKTFPLYSTATDPVTGIMYTSQYDIFTVGAGYLDAWGALNSTDSLPAGNTAPSPVAVFNASTNSVTVTNASTPSGLHAVWGTTNVWGPVVVWGASLFLDGQSALWGTSALWGATEVWGNGGTQGNAAVWGTHAVWGTTTNEAGEAMTLLVNGEN